MKTRIKILRQELRLSQEEFANKIGFTRGAIANAELGRAEIRPQFISLICNTFNVNETWLRTGEGEMFVQLSRDEQIAKFVGDVMRSSDGDFKRSVILALSEMPDECWDVWADFVRKVAEKQKAKPQEE